jgi:ABC-2 type transport system ATP-binding protein
MSAPVVAIDHVEQRFGRRIALSVEALTLRPGITFVTGANGSGKTTLLRLIATVMPATAGSITIGGMGLRSPEDLVAVRRRLGYAPQDDSVPPRLRAYDVVDTIAAMREIGPDHGTRSAAVYRAMQAMDLVDAASERCGRLSGGTRRRVALAAAVVGAPSLLVLDEPTAFLDADQRGRLDLCLGARRSSTTIVIATHDREWVLSGDRVVELASGEVLTDEAL